MPIARRRGLPYTGAGKTRVSTSLPPLPEVAEGQQIVCAIVIPGEPIPKARPRLSNGHVHTPERTVAAERRIAQYVFAQNPRRKLIHERVALSVTFHTAGKARGDLDNYVKLVSDALNGVVWMDDSQVHGLVASVIENSDPGTVIVVILA